MREAVRELEKSVKVNEIALEEQFLQTVRVREAIVEVAKANERLMMEYNGLIDRTEVVVGTHNGMKDAVEEERYETELLDEITDDEMMYLEKRRAKKFLVKTVVGLGIGLGIGAVVSMTEDERKNLKNKVVTGVSKIKEKIEKRFKKEEDELEIVEVVEIVEEDIITDDEITLEDLYEQEMNRR